MSTTTTVVGTTRSRTDRFLKYRRAVQGASIGGANGAGGLSAQDR